jgi:hypothetical protein
MLGTSAENIMNSIQTASMKQSKGFGAALKLGTGQARAIAMAVGAISGYNVAKLEQFEVSQRRMVDSGAIFLEAEETFHDLYKKSIAAGVNYDQFTQLVQKSGDTLQNMGNGVSGGQSRFLTMFKNLNDHGDAFGDFGLRSDEMMTQYLDYIDAQRLGAMVQDIDSEKSQNGLMLGFTDLMLETTELANLTGIKASKQREAINDMKRDKYYQMKKLKLSSDKQSAVDNIVGVLGNMDNPITDSIHEFLMAAVKVGPDGELANLYQMFQEQASSLPEDQRLFFQQMADEGFFEELQTGIRSGNSMSLGIISEYLGKMGERDQGDASSTSGLAYLMKQLQMFAIDGRRHLKNVPKTGSTEDQKKQQALKTQIKLQKSASITQAMNDLTISINTMKEKVVFPLGEASQAIAATTVVFKEFLVNMLMSSKTITELQEEHSFADRTTDLATQIEDWKKVKTSHPLVYEKNQGEIDNHIWTLETAKSILDSSEGGNTTILRNSQDIKIPDAYGAPKTNKAPTSNTSYPGQDASVKKVTSPIIANNDASRQRRQNMNNIRNNKSNMAKTSLQIQKNMLQLHKEMNILTVAYKKHVEDNIINET